MPSSPFHSINRDLRRLSFWAGLVWIETPCLEDSPEMLWATLKPLAPWATPEIPDVFQPVSRKAAFEALRRGVVAFGPEEGRAKRKAAIWGRLRQALRVLGLHRQPRGCFLAYEPRWRWRDEWRVAHLGACSVGTSLLLVTPEWAVATLTGDDD